MSSFSTLKLPLSQNAACYILLRNTLIWVILFLATTTNAFAVQTSFNSGTLLIQLNGANENVSIANNGTNITISSNQTITGSNTFMTMSVSTIIIEDIADAGGQSLTFSSGTNLILAGGLSSTGVETLTFFNSVTVTGNLGISLTAPQTIRISGATLNGGTGGVELTGLGTVAADNYGIQIHNSATVTASGMGEVNIFGKGGADNINTIGVILSNSIVSSSGGDVNITGTGGLGTGVSLTSGGTITAGGMGKVNVDGTSASLFPNGEDYGVQVRGEGSTITSSGGDVTVSGRGSIVDSQPNKKGINVSNGGTISAGGNGLVTVTGHGGISSGNFNRGIEVANGTITSSGGNIQIFGFGGGKASSSGNSGVHLVNGGLITAGGNGTVYIEGTGGNTNAANNYGIEFSSAAIAEVSRISSSGGEVMIKAVGGVNAKDIVIGALGEIRGVGGAEIILEANSLDFTGSPMGSINAPASDVYIIPRSEGIRILLGANDIISPPASKSLGLTNTELARISSGTLTVGRNDILTGNITVASAINLNHIPSVEIITPRSISVEANITSASYLLHFNANQQNVPTAENFSGFSIQNNILVDAGANGNILVTATGGSVEGAIPNHGIFLNGGSIITQQGNIFMEGFKGEGENAYGLMQTGTSQLLAVTGNVIINKVKGWSPGNPNTDVTVGASNFLLFSSDSRLNIQINGLTPNVSYQQLTVQGRINLNGTNLSFNGSSYTTIGNESFTIINNDGTDAVLGIFNGLPEGGVISNFLNAGLDAFITYNGGDGNDVVITVKEPLRLCYESTRGDNTIHLDFTETSTFNDKPRLVSPFFFNFSLYFDPDFHSGAWKITYPDGQNNEILVAYNVSDSDIPPLNVPWVTEGEIGIAGLIIGGTEAATGILSEGTCEPLSACSIDINTACGNTLSGSYAQTGYFDGRPFFTDSNNNGIFFYDFGGGGIWYLTSLGGVVGFTNSSNSSSPPVTGWESANFLCPGATVEVFVNDFDPPLIDCSNINSEHPADEGSCEFTVGGFFLDPIFSDQCSNVSITNDLNFQNTLAGAIFPIGNTQVIWTATDASGNSTHCQLEIEVQDTQTPNLDCSIIPLTLSTDQGTCSYQITNESIDPIFGDNCLATLFNDYNSGASLSGESFPLGGTSIMWTVTDQSDNSTYCSVTIIVSDNEKPVLDCSNINTQKSTDPGQCDFAVTDQSLDPVFSDNCQGVIIFNDFNESNSLNGATLPSGEVAILWIAIDAAGNRDSCLLHLDIADDELPDLDCSNIVPERTNNPGLCGYIVSGNELDPASFSDNCQNSYLINSFTNSETLDGALLSPGNNLITWTVTDESGNKRTCDIIYHIIDNEPPVITCIDGELIFNGEASLAPNPADIVEADGNCGIAGVNLSTPDIFCEQIGQVVPLTVTVTDPNNNTSTCTSNITVSGFPCGWSQISDGVGCTGGNSVSLDHVNEIWTVMSTNCSYGSPFNTDAMAFAQRSLCGDGSITAQVTGISGTALGWAGVIMRESNAPGAKKAQLTTNMAGNQSRREFRLTTNGMAVPQNFPAQSRFWLRVVRSGNQFIMYNSPNGAQWFMIGAQTIDMNSCIEIGLVTTNYNSYSTVTATFANVNYTGTTTQNLPAPGQSTSNDFTTTDFQAYPNPTSGELNLSLNEYIGKKVLIELYSPEGKLMYSIQLDEVVHSSQTIALDRYPDGMYFVKVKAEGLPEVTKRIVLQK